MGYAQRTIAHAEKLVGQELKAMGIDPAKVTRIYTEFAPCTSGSNCAKYVAEMFPQAEVLFSFPHNDVGRMLKEVLFSTFP